MPTDTRAGGGGVGGGVGGAGGGGLASCSSTAHRLVPCRHITCPLETEVHYASGYKATLVENSACIMKGTGRLCAEV